MKNLYKLVIGAMFAGMALVAPAKAQVAPLTLISPVVGTWNVTTTLNVPGLPPFVFTELATFNAGGTFVGTFALDRNGANPYVPGLFQVDFSAKFGNWGLKPGTLNQYNLILKEFLFAGPLTPDAVYGPHFLGQNVGTAVVTGSPTFSRTASGDKLTGPITVKFMNAAGGPLFTAEGSVVATRLN